MRQADAKQKQPRSPTEAGSSKGGEAAWSMSGQRMGVDCSTDNTMTRVAIVLYSYGRRRDRQRSLYAHSLSRISRRGLAKVYLTVDPGEVPPSLPGINAMQLDSPPGYEHLPDKTIAMLRWLAQKPDWDYVIKCDDDVLLDPAAVRALAEQRSLPDYQSVATYVCGGDGKATYHRGKCTDPVLNDTDLDTSWGMGMAFAVGHCYMLSRRAVEAVLEELDSGGFSIEAARAAFDIRGVGGEDLLVGYLLRERCIRPVESLRLLQSKPRLRGLVRHLVRESLAAFRNQYDDRLCVGAITDNRLPWWGEYRVLRTWFFVSHILGRLLGRRVVLPHHDEPIAARCGVAGTEPHGGR